VRGGGGGGGQPPRNSNAQARAAGDAVLLLPHGVQLDLIDGRHDGSGGGNVLQVIGSEIRHANAGDLRVGGQSARARRKGCGAARGYPPGPSPAPQREHATTRVAAEHCAGRWEGCGRQRASGAARD
jgi:hypothetical protein